MHRNEKWLKAAGSDLGRCYVRCDYSAAINVNPVNIKGQKRNFVLGSSTKLEKPCPPSSVDSRVNPKECFPCVGEGNPSTDCLRTWVGTGHSTPSPKNEVLRDEAGPTAQDWKPRVKLEAAAQGRVEHHLGPYPIPPGGAGSVLSDAGHEQYSKLGRYSTVVSTYWFFLLSKNNLREFKIHSSNKSLKESQVYLRIPSEKSCSEEQSPMDPKDTTPARGCEWHREMLAQTGWTAVQCLHLRRAQLSWPLS